MTPATQSQCRRCGTDPKTIDFVKGVPGLLEDLVAADGEGVLGQVYKNDSGLFVVSIDKTKKLYGKSYLYIS